MINVNNSIYKLEIDKNLPYYYNNTTATVRVGGFDHKIIIDQPVNKIFSDFINSNKSENEIEIAIKTKKRVRQIQLPEKVRVNLRKYLKEGRPEASFCCGDFVNFLYDKSRAYGMFFWEDWEISQWGGDLSPGQVVLLLEKESYPDIKDITGKDLKHFAVYLGSNTYISISPIGPLICMNIKCMETLFASKSILVLNP